MEQKIITEVMFYYIHDNYVVIKGVHFFMRWNRWRLTHPEYANAINNNEPMSIEELKKFKEELGIYTTEVPDERK